MATLAEKQEEMRATLRHWGWPEWREADRRESDRLEHGVALFTVEHERGPLVEWLHPEECDCLL